MLYCQDCAAQYGFPLHTPPLVLLECNICGVSKLVGSRPMKETPLRERLEVANRVQEIIDKVYKYDDVKPLPLEFLDRVEPVMERDNKTPKFDPADDV